MNELEALAERCEKAEGADRELDCAIAEAVKSSRVRNGSVNISAAYTASLDAAMMLVPEGFCWIIGKRPGAESRTDGYHAAVWSAPGAPFNPDGTWAATPALALGAASLRARALAPAMPV